MRLRKTLCDRDTRWSGDLLQAYDDEVVRSQAQAR